MIPFIMMVLGLGLIIWSLYLIRRDIEKGNLKLTRSIESFDDSSAVKLLQVLEELENQMTEMNQSFYELVSDLEGSFSIHDKELQLLTERMVKIEKQLGMITSEIKITHEVKENYSSRGKQSRAYQPPKVESEATKAVKEHIELMSTNDEKNEITPQASKTNATGRGMLSLSPEESTQLKQKIVNLRKEGHNLSQIAKILNIGIGELQLFIKLNTK